MREIAESSKIIVRVHINRIIEIVKMKLMSLIVKDSHAVKRVEMLWSIAFKRRKVVS